MIITGAEGKDEEDESQETPSFTSCRASLPQPLISSGKPTRFGAGEKVSVMTVWRSKGPTESHGREERDKQHQREEGRIKALLC